MIKSIQNKGITLVALVITIVVLLVLAGVILNSMQESGIIGKAGTAKDKTNKAAEKEQLRLAVMSAYDEKTKAISKQTLESELGTGWQVAGEEGGPYGVTSPKENVYTVTKTGEIAEGWSDNGDGTFTKGDTTVEIGKTTYTNAEVLEKLGATGGTYTGTWTVIGVEGEKLKLVSTTNVTNCTLGEKDNPEKSISDYKNAVSILNTAAETATGITGARSITIEDIYDIIGEENVDKGSSYGTVYNYYFDTDKLKVCSKKKTGTDENGEEQWGSASTTPYVTHTFVDSEGRTVTIDVNNPDASVRLSYDSFNYTLTDAQKSAIGSLATGYYWLASPCVKCYPYYAYFYVRYMKNGGIFSNDLFGSYGGEVYSGSGVRAVVSI